MAKSAKTSSVTVTIDSILSILEERFVKNKQRHKDIGWLDVKTILEKNKSKLDILLKMEESGGEPDVIDFGDNKITFVDCSKESPEGRRSFCYDELALQTRKEFKPKNSAVGFAKEIGIELLNEEQYLFIQSIEDFDLKTSSWIKTPASVRKLGGSIFGDKRYDRVFFYHNGAESYYGSRGFRGLLLV